MKKSISLSVFFLTIFLLGACDNGKKEVAALAKETEAIHDAAMKDMAEMNRVARALKDFMISATMTPEQSQKFNDALTTMGNAENDMMDWMKNYKSPDALPSAEALKYLQEQKKLIENNHIDIKSATEAGKKLLPQE
jgi:hypothetical protein